MPQFKLRQQLSSTSLHALEKAARNQLAHLHQLRIEVGALTSGTAGLHPALDKVDALIAETELAVTQLGRVYADQFEQGRAQNDAAGHTGLVNGEQRKAA